ncbi:MAG: hypothetical protein DME32_06105 [Verrucomicrobia bacterium]|nr:MAG: hypothetical protein DME32_06105 [Verrucomicrobiota bacterium]
MSLEPKKPIEDLLEATARARRAQFGADPMMPNPMRAQMHHEIARIGREDDSRRSEHWFRILWPRLAFTTAFALILVSISTLWWWREHQTGGGETMKLAMQEPAREAAPPEQVFEQGAAAPASSAAPTFADSNAAASRPAEAAKDADALGRFTEATTAPTEATPLTQGLMAGATKSDQPSLADKSLGQVGAIDLNRPSAAKEAKPAAPPTASLAQSRQMTNFRQQFSKDGANQAFRGKLKQTASILNEFQVEQSDHEIRLVDADGSTYSGKLEPLAQNDARSIYNQKKNYTAPLGRAARTFDEKAQSANAEYYFRATGYNTSLKKSLVFEGNFITPLAVAQKKVAKAKTESEERDEEASARITGVAKIHGESPVQIDAIAVP